MKSAKGCRPSIILGSLLISFIIGVKSQRKISAELNPGCKDPACNNITLVHVKAEGKNDTLHHLWDFTGKPSLFLALTDRNASISIAWSPFALGEKDAIKFDVPPKYVYSVVFDKLIEFNDEDNTGSLNETMTNSSYITVLDTKNFDWKVVSFTNGSNNSTDATLTVEANAYSDIQNGVKKNGTVRIMVSAYGGEAHSESLPHMLHSGNASQMDIVVDGLSTQYKYSRFGLHLITISSDSSNKTVKVESRKTMDDQHAPGIFTVVEMKTEGVECGGYLQWRPVVYVTPAREMTSSTDSVQYLALPPQDPMATLSATLPFSALGTQLASMQVSATNVTFGITGDGFYKKTRYATWSVVVGYGHPPEEQFSMLVTLVLLIGLGLPAILVVAGTLCIVLRRLQRNKDDLFLSR